MLIIIGAGLSGLSCALKLKGRKRFLIIEKEKEIGGLARTVKKDGFLFDFSGHLLHLRWDNTKKFIFSLLGQKLKKIERISEIYFNGVYIDYPFQINLYNLPKNIKEKCVYDFISARIQKNKQDTSNLETWAKETFGKSIAEYFFIPYNQKLFSFPLQKMTANWISGFVPVPTITEVIRGAYEKKIENIGYNHHFYYPLEGGISTLPNALADKIKEDIITGEEVAYISFKNKEIKLKKGDILRYEKLISTIPLKEFIMKSDAPSKIKELASKLKHNTVYILNIGIKKTPFKQHWIYFPQREFPFYRIGFYTNFSKRLAPKELSSLYIETSVYQNSVIDIQSVESKIIKVLERLSVIKSKNDIITSMWLKIECGYVIYDRERENVLNKIFEFLNKNNVKSIGRYGGWKYSFMEENIKEGFETAEEIIRGGDI